MYPFFKIPNKMHIRQNSQQNSLHVQQNTQHNTRVSTPETEKNSSNNTNASEVKAASNMLHSYYKKKHKNWENILLRREAVFLLPRWTADRAFWQVKLIPLHLVRITMWADILIMSEMLNRRTTPPVIMVWMDLCFVLAKLKSGWSVKKIIFKRRRRKESTNCTVCTLYRYTGYTKFKVNLVFDFLKLVIDVCLLVRSRYRSLKNTMPLSTPYSLFKVPGGMPYNILAGPNLWWGDLNRDVMNSRFSSNKTGW